MVVLIKNLFLIFILGATIVNGVKRERVVNIKQGSVRGYLTEGIFAFYNIPYASAPTGVNKYKPPLPPPTWNGVFEAKDKKVICPQPNLEQFIKASKEAVVMEDCLITNIYLPDTNETNLPVIVYVHGGAFQGGHGNWITPKYLVKSKKVIVANFNYRLGIHGNLCLGTEEAPGNAGMKDQVTFLKWVKNNIEMFGGNPTDVTLGGMSSGSAAVNLLMISPLTKGLFTKVIPESAGSLGPWPVQMDPIENVKEYLRTYTSFSDFDNFDAIQDFFLNTPLNVLITDSFLNRTDSTLLFVPCVENGSVSSESEIFLHDAPWNILKRGDYNKVPLLYGITSMEGQLRLRYFDMWKTKMNEKFSDFLPADLQFNNEVEKEEVAKLVKQFYFGNKSIGDETILNYIDLFGDIFFIFPVLKSTQLHVEAGNEDVYLYEYNYVDERDTPSIPHTDARGPDHCAQTMAVLDCGNLEFPIISSEANITDEYRRLKIIMRELWYNFATTGKPVPEGSTLPSWPAVKAETSPHMSISQTLELRGGLLKERFRFWDNIYEKYIRIPIPPSRQDG